MCVVCYHDHSEWGEPFIRLDAYNKANCFILLTGALVVCKVECQSTEYA